MTTSVHVLRLALALYGVGAAAYVLFFANARRVGAASAGAALVALGFVVHGASIALACSEFGGWEFFALRGGLGMVAWVGAGTFLLVERLHRVPSAGAFVLPLVLVSALPSGFPAAPAASDAVGRLVQLPAVKLHVAAALGGVAVFAIACGIALMYLLQEREVKGKRFGRLFPRLPSLGVLDRLNRLLVRVGFAVFTVALVSGALVAKHAWGGFWTWDAKEIVSLVVWLAYGALVHLARAGVHGRRAAWGTMAAFGVALASMVGLSAFPELTRHQGDYVSVVGPAAGAGSDVIPAATP